MKHWELTSEAFDLFLTWLHTDREEAAREYQALHRRLILFFECRRCADAEGLADETLNRAMRQIPELRHSFTGEPIHWLYGVAHYIHLEYLQQRVSKDGGEVSAALPDPHNQQQESEQEHLSHCLEECLQKLSGDDRHLVLQYYRENKQAKIDYRKQLAEQRGWSAGNLRIRVNRIRNLLQECITACLHKQRDVTF